MDETFLNGPNDLVMEISRISPNDEEEKKKMLSSTIKNDFSEDSQRKQKNCEKCGADKHCFFDKIYVFYWTFSAAK